MALIERDREPSATELRWFGLMMVAFFGLMGGLAYARRGELGLSMAMWAGSIVFAIAYYALPSIRRTSYRAWIAVTYPIGWTVSHLVLGAFFYLIFTPVGLAMRLFGRDPMQRRLDRACETYWVEHRAPANSARYWRQSRRDLRKLEVRRTAMPDSHRNKNPQRHSDFLAAERAGSDGLASEVLGFLRESRKWWLAPIIIGLLLIGLGIVLGEPPSRRSSTRPSDIAALPRGASVRKFLVNAILIVPGLLTVGIVATIVYVFHAPLSWKSIAYVLCGVLYLAACIVFRRDRRMLGRLAVTAWSATVVALLYGPVNQMMSGEWRPDPIWSSAYDGLPWWHEFVSEHRDSNRLWWQSYVYWRRPPYEGNFIKVDGRGVRRTWNAPAKDGAVPKRIFFFGGSTTWGSGARDEYTIPSDVSRKLSEKGFDVEVTNFGESGWVSTQGVIMLMLELRKHNVPDVVVFYDGINDVHAAFQNREAGIPGNEVNRRKQFYGSRALVNDDKPAIDDATLAGETIDLYLANVDLVQALADRYGFSVVAVWQPVSYVDKQLTAEEKAMADDLGAPMSRFYRDAYQLMRTRAPANVLDLSGTFAGVTDRVYLDHAHLSELGNDLVAQGIAAKLESVLSTRGGNPSSPTRQASAGH